MKKYITCHRFPLNSDFKLFSSYLHFWKREQGLKEKTCMWINCVNNNFLDTIANMWTNVYLLFILRTKANSYSQVERTMVLVSFCSNLFFTKCFIRYRSLTWFQFIYLNESNYKRWSLCDTICKLDLKSRSMIALILKH